ncbi:hypothetical protein KIK84_11735 [Curvibacter sp. CHRR-16]|uniref:hypothetical protein n=1 Tax=Curvibacter sp. CHRR-16 TaxID=2835872 RepID=UPI001BDAB35F|nr:hypothetical protein [Curvibacter sp. CHRR-16]MBT0571003.1 hypothetical protein [Curvibacter sp. CHRR-16]
MRNVTGYLELNLTKTDGSQELVTVSGDEFGLEEGGDWRRDKDDGDLYAGFLFIAFCEGFDLMLSVNIHGNHVTHYSLSLREKEFEEFDIQRLVITADELDVNGLFPNVDDDVDL